MCDDAGASVELLTVSLSCGRSAGRGRSVRGSRACAAAAAPRVSDIGTCARPRPHWCPFSWWFVLEASMELSACPHEVCSTAGTSEAA